MIIFSLTELVQHLRQGAIIAYPTEAVYGLGCAANDPDAIARLLQLKQRDPSKGLIVIGSHWHMLRGLLKPLAQESLTKIRQSWPGANTWILPKADSVSSSLSGGRETLAVRIPASSAALSICQAFGGAIISTSANVSGQGALLDAADVEAQFGAEVYVFPRSLGRKDGRPSTIRDLHGNILR